MYMTELKIKKGSEGNSEVSFLSVAARNVRYRMVQKTKYLFKVIKQRRHKTFVFAKTKSLLTATWE